MAAVGGRRGAIKSDDVEREVQKKLDVVADIDSLQGQLQKPSPSNAVVRTLWKGIEATVTAAGFGELVAKAAAMIAPLLG